MKNRSIQAFDTLKALMSADPIVRNRALKSLYMSPAVNGKIKAWAKQYNVRDKEADDVLQEGIIKLDQLVRDGRFRGESKVETFLLGICLNIIRDASKKVQRIEFKADLTDADMHTPEDLADNLSFVSVGDVQQNQDNALAKAMSQLTEICREALSLYYIKEKSMAEVAQERGLANPNQAKKTMHRCREQLRTIILNDPNLSTALK